jgi:RHS repeat-associated protein
MRPILPCVARLYSYAGIGYANPHAVTDIGYTGGATTTHVYDNNGNLTSASRRGYTWDYRNRLSAAGAGGATTTYSYDHENQRVQKKTSIATTTYVNMYFNIASSTTYATTTKHIFTPSGELLATVVGTGTTTATTTYLHPDHLGGTNVVTDGSGSSAQVLDYYPYGSQRIVTGSHDSQRRYIGEHYDPETAFSYLNARYYEGSRGQFMSQDPVFLHLGDQIKVKETTKRELQQLLIDPQALNSYSYARNNPLLLSDASGEFFGVGSLASWLVKTSFGAFGLANSGVSIADAWWQISSDGLLTAQERRAFGSVIAGEILFLGLCPAVLCELGEAGSTISTLPTTRSQESSGGSSGASVSGLSNPNPILPGAHSASPQNMDKSSGTGGLQLTSIQQSATQTLKSTITSASFDAEAFVSALNSFIGAFNLN